MIKKKVLCCGVVLSGLLLTKLQTNAHFGASDKLAEIFANSKNVHAHRYGDGVNTTEEKKENEKKESFKEYLNSLTFANDTLPTGKILVESKLRTFLHKFSFHKNRSYSLHRKAEKYLPEIAVILASYGIPEDFKYIPLVESGMENSVVSSKGAAGFWQFMPATARTFGLKVNGNTDERLNLTKSTHAAARYIKYLYKQFGDWTLVAAAYNVGDGSLKQSIRRQHKNNYFELKLNSETGSYVYKLVSMKEIIENPQLHGYTRYANKDQSDMDNLADKSSNMM